MNPELERQWMARAVELARRSAPEDGRADATPLVGAVIARGEELLAESYRGETGNGDHAEFCALGKLAEGADLTGASCFATLEPCSKRSPEKTPCAERLANSGIETVYVGIYDPNPQIFRSGFRRLRASGIIVKDFPSDLRETIRTMNSGFLAQYEGNPAEAGKATFDYTMQNGRYVVGEGPLAVQTTWSTAADGLIHAYGDQGRIALARHATEFSDIHDAGALDYSSTNQTPREGEIVVFATDSAYALVRVVTVIDGTHRDDRIFQLVFDYEIRPA